MWCQCSIFLFLHYYKIKTGVKISDFIVQNRSLTEWETFFKLCLHLFISCGEWEHESQHSSRGLKTTWRCWCSLSTLWSWVRDSGTQPRWQVSLHIAPSQQWLRILMISKLKFTTGKSNFSRMDYHSNAFHGQYEN